MTQGERIAAELRRAWNGAPWHGPSAAKVIGRLNAKQAATRRARGSHTAWEFVLHMTVWVESPLRRLDDASYEPPVDFPEPVTTSDQRWTEDVARLGETIEGLAGRVERMTDEQLESPVGAKGYSYVWMLDGVAQHLAYHCGQVAVLALEEETAGVIMPPPLILIGAMLVAEELDRFLRFPMMGSLLGGIGLAAAGVGLVLWAHEYFVRHKTPAEPWRASRALVRGGPYRYTRNPMYIGFLITQVGVGVARHNAWYLVMLVPAWMMLHWGVVLREERYLLKRFGEPYRQFLDATRRWLT